MTAELVFQPGLYSTGRHTADTTQMRNLGSAIFLAAIVDYRSVDQEAHDHAELFLYPQTQDWQDHYDWAVALFEGLNPSGCGRDWIDPGLSGMESGLYACGRCGHRGMQFELIGGPKG